jgi:hypothetical protein
MECDPSSTVNVFYASQKYLCFFKTELPCVLCFGGYFLFLLIVFLNFLEPNKHCALQMDSGFRDSFTGAN